MSEEKADSKNYFYAPFNKQEGSIQPTPAAPAVKLKEFLKRDMPNPNEVLTEREMQLLTMIAENKNNAEITKMTGLSEDWLNGYIRNILAKLAVDNEVQAVKRAYDEGLIDSAPLLQDDMWG